MFLKVSKLERGGGAKLLENVGAITHFKSKGQLKSHLPIFLFGATNNHRKCAVPIYLYSRRCITILKSFSLLLFMKLIRGEAKQGSCEKLDGDDIQDREYLSRTELLGVKTE